MRFKLLIPGTVAVVGAFAASSPGELPRGVTRPRPICAIPNYLYSTVPAAKATVTAVSLARIPANRLSAAAPPTTNTQVYQLTEARLQIDHCFLSRFAVALQDDGAYTISFRADQNPVASDDLSSPLRTSDKPWTLQTSQLLRNQFIVKVRGYAAYPAPAVPPKLAAGKPALVEFPLEPFWVERAKPYSGFVSGKSDVVRKNFEFIDRVEVEFTYK